MSRQYFPCDVRTAADRQLKRAKKAETPVADFEGLLPDVEMSTLPFEFDKLMAAVAKVHPRATSWIRARLEGTTDIELAAQWGVTPQALMRWKYSYELKIKAVFAKFLEVDVDLSTESLCATHRSLAA